MGRRRAGQRAPRTGHGHAGRRRARARRARRGRPRRAGRLWMDTAPPVRRGADAAPRPDRTRGRRPAGRARSATSASGPGPPSCARRPTPRRRCWAFTRGVRSSPCAPSPPTPAPGSRRPGRVPAPEHGERASSRARSMGVADPPARLAFLLRPSRRSVRRASRQGPSRAGRFSRCSWTASGSPRTSGIVPRSAVRLAWARPRPEEIGPDERWVHVDTDEQTLTAYEGDRMVFATLVSTGKKGWETPTGVFRVWLKVRHARMHGHRVPIPRRGGAGHSLLRPRCRAPRRSLARSVRHRGVARLRERLAGRRRVALPLGATGDAGRVARAQSGQGGAAQRSGSSWRGRGADVARAAAPSVTPTALRVPVACPRAPVVDARARRHTPCAFSSSVQLERSVRPSCGRSRRGTR